MTIFDKLRGKLSAPIRQEFFTNIGEFVEGLEKTTTGPRPRLTGGYPEVKNMSEKTELFEKILAKVDQITAAKPAPRPAPKPAAPRKSRVEEAQDEAAREGLLQYARQKNAEKAEQKEFSDMMEADGYFEVK